MLRMHGTDSRETPGRFRPRGLDWRKPDGTGSPSDNARNELLTEMIGLGTTTYSHDDNGNRSQKTVSGGSTTGYV